MSTLQATPPVKLIRPAVIEFRFNKVKAYEQQIRLFKRALKPDTVIVKYSACYFPITVTPGGTQKEMELRFVLLKKAQLGNTRTIVYWEVPRDSMRWTSDSLVTRHGFKVLEKIQIQPIDSSSQTLLEATSDPGFLASKGMDRTLGLVVNPPYPTLTLHNNSTTTNGIPTKDTTANGTKIKDNYAGEAESSPTYFVWIGCVVALLIGFMVGRLGRK